MIAKEVDDEDEGKQQQKISQQQQVQVGRSTGPVDWPAVSEARSTGPVDRRAQCAQVGARSTARSPTEVTQLSVGHPVDRPVDRWKGRSTAQSTDSRVRAASADLEILFVFKGLAVF